MQIFNPAILDDIFEERDRAFKSYCGLMQQLIVSLDSFLNKFDFVLENDRYYEESCYRMLGVVNSEIDNINYHMADLLNMLNEAILPISNNLVSEKELFPKIHIIEGHLFRNPELEKSPYSVIFSKCGVILLSTAASLRQGCVKTSEEAVPIFHDLLQKYKDDHRKDIACYSEDNISNPMAKYQLRKDYEEYKAVRCWNRNERDVSKTIEALRNEKAVELDLLPLFRYIALYDALNDIAPTQTKSETHIHANRVNIQETGDIIMDGCVQNNIGQVVDHVDSIKMSQTNNNLTRNQMEDILSQLSDEDDVDKLVDEWFLEDFELLPTQEAYLDTKDISSGTYVMEVYEIK